MSNLKIFQGPKHGVNSLQSEAPEQLHTSQNPEHHEARPETSYSHDKTPARQREFESQGFQNRSLFDPRSNGRSSNSQSHHPQGFKSNAQAGQNLINSDGRPSLFNSHNANSSSSHAGQVQGEQHPSHQLDGPGKQGLINLRSSDGPGRSQLLSGSGQAGQGRPSDRLWRPNSQGEQNGQSSSHHDNQGWKTLKDNGRSFDPNWGQRTSNAFSPDRGNGRGVDRSWGHRTPNSSAPEGNNGRIFDRGWGQQGQRAATSSTERGEHGWNHRTPNTWSPDRNNGLGRLLRDSLGDQRNQFRNVGRDGRNFPPGLAKKDSGDQPGRHNGWEGFRNNHGFKNDNLRNRLDDAFRSVNDQLRTVSRDFARATHGPRDRGPDFSDRLSARINYAIENRVSLGNPPDRVFREVTSDVVNLGRLSKHFAQLERTGGEPVRQAYQAVLDFVLRERRGEEFDRLRFAADLLRDLDGGAFLFREEFEGPFPLTGRARVVSEMIALMRTLDAIDAFRTRPDWPLPRTGGFTGYELFALLENVLRDVESGPMLPGLAARLEIPRLVAQLEGLLNGFDGKPLLMLDGKALRAGDLLWLNLLTNSASWGDRMGAKLASPLVYGFDSVFSLIGFDGRSLTVPHFLGVQSQVNAFDFDWVTGQAPLCEGWMRSAIESLKDSRILDHNILGEMLEEALTQGRFHLLVMRGTVEEGKPVAGSFSFSPLYNVNGQVVASTS